MNTDFVGSAIHWMEEFISVYNLCIVCVNVCTYINVSNYQFQVTAVIGAGRLRASRLYTFHSSTNADAVVVCNKSCCSTLYFKTTLLVSSVNYLTER